VKGYPRWFEPTLLGVVTVVFLSGCLLLPTTLEMRAEWRLGWRLAPDARLWVAAAHAAVAFLFLLVMGSLWSVHMRAGWRRHRERVSGMLLVLCLLWLALSALGVYYLADEAWARVAGLGHLVIGVLVVLPFTWHGVMGWRHRRRRRSHH
jgi:hypothetical protein